MPPFDYVSKTFWIRLEDIFRTCKREQFNLIILLENDLKTSSRRLQDVFTRRLEDVLKRCWRRLSKTSCVLMTSWKRLEDALKTYDKDKYTGLDQNVLKTSSKRLLKTYESGEFIRLDQDILKTSSEDEDERCLPNIFKTSSSRQMFAGLRVLVSDVPCALSFLELVVPRTLLAFVLLVPPLLQMFQF